MITKNFDELKLFLQALPYRSLQLKIISDILGLKINSIAEIGVYRGSNAKCLRNLFPQAELYLIDPWVIYPEYKKQEAGSVTLDDDVMTEAYERVVKHFGNDPLAKIIRKKSEDAVNDVDEVDIVFIDGNHSYDSVMQDINLWHGKVREGGILAGHDYGVPGPGGVKKAVDEYFGDDVIIGSDCTWIKLIHPSYTEETSKIGFSV